MYFRRTSRVDFQKSTVTISRDVCFKVPETLFTLGHAVCARVYTQASVPKSPQAALSPCGSRLLPDSMVTSGSPTLPRPTQHREAHTHRLL